jgi:hypothetical protein
LTTTSDMEWESDLALSLLSICVCNASFGSSRASPNPLFQREAQSASSLRDLQLLLERALCSGNLQGTGLSCITFLLAQSGYVTPPGYQSSVYDITFSDEIQLLKASTWCFVPRNAKGPLDAAGAYHPNLITSPKPLAHASGEV